MALSEQIKEALNTLTEGIKNFSEQLKEALNTMNAQDKNGWVIKSIKTGKYYQKLQGKSKRIFVEDIHEAMIFETCEDCEKYMKEHNMSFKYYELRIIL